MDTVNKQTLRELAGGAAHWSGSLAHVWPSDPDFNDAWTVGTIDEDGNKYPVIEVDADQYGASEESEKIARFIAAANPDTILALLDSYEALQAECEKLRKDAGRYVPLNEAVQRAAAELPEGWEIQLCVARDSGWVDLIGPDGTEDFDTNNERLDYTVIDALEFAIDAAMQEASHE